MLEKIDPVWLHRIIRFGLGSVFIGVATQFDDAWPLYIFGGVMFISGFIRPRRCIDDKCDL
ncbi:hypothetical protein ACFSQD_07965 [Flavihumibacter stibioxidans]|uniref:YrhK domain-containing protein n=1 Tax=Flavihumibacter stibioxidans TaxID=1834163 RepID=A0ABR7M5E2_9BACT|nr:hypothetical protein [Flavihumibacter stibioxidans]MBC6490242.1 hypothetical protein [Flavihumibacter stibioxidans]